MPSGAAKDVGRRQRVLITGASGGIGEAFAHIIAEEGFDLVIVARSEGELNRVKGVLSARHPGLEIVVIARDLSEPEAARLIHDELAQRSLLPDIVINNAGYGLAGPSTSRPVESEVGIVDVNVRALTELTLRCLPYMLARREGGILNVASVAAFMPGPYMATYYASKAYVLSFSEALAAEFAGSGITVTVLCPGPVRTGFQSRAGMKPWGALQALTAVPVHDVAQAGWDGFKQHRRVVVPGLLNLLIAYAGRYLPRWLVLPVLKRVQAPR